MIAYPSYADQPNERLWTGDRGECVNVDRYHAADCESSEFEVLELVAAFVRALQPDTVIETGAAYGYGSQAIGNALKANGHGHLFSLEIDPHRANDARERVVGLPVSVIQCDSLDFEPPRPVGLAFFDSLTDLRDQEFRRYFPHFSPGAIVAFHDTGPQHVTWRLVQQLESEQMLKAVNLRTPRGIAFAQVLND